MGRLSGMPSRLGSVAPRLAPAPKLAESFYQSKEWRGLAARLKAQRGRRCERCGSADRLIADHIVERKDGGADLDPANIELLCFKHHAEKTATARAKRARGEVSLGGVEAASRPSWFTRTHVPLTLVCGPPGAGKSTYVRARARQDDLVVCFDEIAKRLWGNEGSSRTRVALSKDQRLAALRYRNKMLGDLMRPSASKLWPRAWMIATEPVASDREWWVRVVGAQIVVLAVSKHECLRRIDADAANGDERGTEARQFVGEWWSRYRPAACDLTIGEGGASKV